MLNVVVASLLLAASPATAPAGRAAPSQERDWGEPPAGASPEDRALWSELREGTAAATVHLQRMAQAGYRTRYGRYYESLDARKGDAAAAAARAELADAARAAQQVIPARPGIHACRRVHLDLDQRIELPRAFEDGAKVRREARDCAAKMKALVAAVEPVADRLDAALARVDALLGRASPAAPAGAAPVAPDDAAAAFREGAR